MFDQVVKRPLKILNFQDEAKVKRNVATVTGPILVKF